MTFVEAVRSGFVNWDKTWGRSTCAELGYWLLFSMQVTAVVLAVFLLTGQRDNYDLNRPPVFMVILMLAAIGLHLLAIPIMIRRLHDLNLGGFWLYLLPASIFVPPLWALIPALLFLFLFVGLFVGPRNEGNRFGPDPRKRRSRRRRRVPAEAPGGVRATVGAFALRELEWFVAAVKSGLANGLKFTGRATRRETFYWMLFVVTAVPAVLLVATMLDVARGTGGGLASGAVPWLLANATPVLLWGFNVLTVSVMVRRLHDMNLSGWWLMVLFVPVYHLPLWLLFLPGLVLVLLVEPRNEGNRFGPDPRMPAMAAASSGGKRRP